MKKFLPLVLAGIALLTGCLPVFVREGALLDVNATSRTCGLYILPKDYHGRISAWYFGHST